MRGRARSRLLNSILMGSIGLMAACGQAAVPRTPITSVASGVPTSPQASTSPTATATTAPAPVPSPPSELTVSLPVVACRTTTGGGPAARPPSRVTVALDSASEGRLAAYGDGVDLVLGPAGYACAGSIGMDGSTLLAIKSRDDPNNLVEVTTTGACQGCAVAQACSVFAEAARQAPDYAGCYANRPIEEQLTAINAELVGFRDEAGVSGTGVGSGLWNPSLGVVWFREGAYGLEAAQISCTLDAGRTDLCHSIVAAYTAALPATAPPGRVAKIADASGWPPESCGLGAPSPDRTAVVIVGANQGSCDLAKHALLRYGVFRPFDVTSRPADLETLCIGARLDWGGGVQIWDSGDHELGTRLCQAWDLVAP